MSNFWQRTLTGAVFVAVLVGAVLAGPYGLSTLLLVINGLGLAEFARLFRKQELSPSVPLIVIIGTLAMFIILAESMHHISSAVVLPLLFILLWVPYIFELFGRRNNPFQRASLTVGGLIYLTVGLTAFYLLGLFHRETISQYSANNYNPYIYLSFFILLWSSDTFAYLSGRAFGKHPLFPRVSPKKTWEGSIGGAVLTVGMSLLISLVFHWLLMWPAIIMALVIVIFGTIGDLVESMLKRSLDIKDSGNILPGHGGILDRFDSLLFSAPFVMVAFFVYILLVAYD